MCIHEWLLDSRCQAIVMKSWYNEHLIKHWLTAVPILGSCITAYRGSQYTSRGYQVSLEQAGIFVSMPRKGNYWNNAARESLFGTLKDECLGNSIYVSHDEAHLAIFTYLEVYYNRIRRHSTPGYVSPFIYEQCTMKEEVRNA